MKISKYNEKIKKVLFFIIIAILLSSVFFVLKSKHRNEENISAEIRRTMQYRNVKAGDEKTSSEYVSFDAFFLKDIDGDGIAEAKRGTCNEIGKQDTLYFELKVTENGYLKDGVISIDSKNFYFNTSIVKDAIVKNNYISADTETIELNTVNSGSQKLFTGMVKSGDYSNKSKIFEALKLNINNYSKINSITLTGTHVSDDNVETRINKTVNFNVDWYGITSASIETSSIRQVIDPDSLNGNNVSLDFTITTSENANELLLKEAIIEGTIPKLNGYSASSLTIVGDNITYDFDQETGNFHASNKAVTDSNGFITKQCYDVNYYDYHNGDKSKRYNEWKIVVTYPIEAFNEEETSTIQLIIPMKAVYFGYNNNTEFDNPYISNTATTAVTSVWKIGPDGDGIDFGVDIGKTVYKPYKRRTISKAKPLKIYNSVSNNETEDYYEVYWTVYSGSGANSLNLALLEDKKNINNKVDNFITTDGTKISMENYTSNVGISFKGVLDLLGEDGWIKIYNNDNNSEIVTLTSNNWNEEYWYEYPIKHIRIETSPINKNATCTFINIKQLDDSVITSNIDVSEFSELEHIDTTLTAYYGESEPKVYNAVADYEEPYSIARLTIDEKNISTQQPDDNPEIVTFNISANSLNYNERKWKNGIFLLKMPEDVLDIQIINSITTDNPNVEISNYEIFEKNGYFFIRINTENQEETTYNITFEATIRPNPRIPSKTEQIELYAKNEQSASYINNFSSEDIYDLDLNGNVIEKVSKDTVTINFVSPNNLLTNQQARNIDSVNDVIIAPRVAKISKELRTATVDVIITNNYSSEITDVIIQGVIPFRGNKYIISEGDLGSVFDTTMTEDGLSIDSFGNNGKDISSTTTVYYSTLEKPSNDINDPTNRWVTAENVEDWSQIKTYLISLGSYKLSEGESHSFSYNIRIPNGLNYNDISYSEHGVYFALITDAGKYYTSTAVNKLGFMIAKQFDLEIIKYQKNTTKKLPNIAFRILEDGANSGSTRKTDENGKLELFGLFAERKYKIIEYRTTDNYVLNEEEIEFYTYTDENDNLLLAYKNADGTYSSLEQKYSWIKSASIISSLDEDLKVHLEIENDVKAKLSLTKKSGEDFLRNVKFCLNGKGISNLILQTDEFGNLSTSGLFVDEVYTLSEIKADGYYINDGAIKFKIVSSGINTFNLNIIENNDDVVSSSGITMVDYIPTVNLVIEDTKIPTYNLEIRKYAKNEDNNEDITLQGAQFILYGDGLSDNGIILTTDENGKANLSGLYEYVEKNGEPKGNITAEYTLKEIYAPEGYALDSTEIRFKSTRNSNGELEIEVLSGEERIRDIIEGENTIKDVNVLNSDSDNPTAYISIEDPPIFELSKVDEDNNPVEGVKFNIYSIDDSGNVSTAIDMNGNEISTCITNSSGKISLNLPEGLYKAVEIETPNKFIFDENEEKRTTYFGIGTSKPAESEFMLEWTSAVQDEAWDSINCVAPTSDGGIVAVGSFYESALINNNEENILSSEGYKDGLIVKYKQDGSIDWYKNIGGSADDEIVKVVQTIDNGYAIIGNIQSESININSSITLNGIKDGLLIKLNSNGDYEWSKTIGGELDDYLYSISEDSNGNLIITGGYCSSELKIPNGNGYETLSNLGKMNGFVISYSSDGNTLNWFQRIGGDSVVRAVDAIQVSSGYIVAANYIGTAYLEKTNTQSVPNYASETQDIVLVWYNSNGVYNKKLRIGGADNDKISGLINYDGGIIAYGQFMGDIDADDNGVNDFSSNGNMDSFLFKYSTAGDLETSSSISFGGTLDEGLGEVSSDGDKLIIGGWTYSTQIDIDGDGTNDITKSANNADSYVLVLNKSLNGYEIDKLFKQSGTSDEEGRTACATIDGGFVIAGTSSSSALTIEGPTNSSVSGRGYSDGFIAKYREILTSPEFVQQQQLKISNIFKKYTITTELYSILADSTKQYDVGGTITGEYGIYENKNYPGDNHIRYVETVKYDENANEDIIITPAEGYVVSQITINGEEIDFTPNNEGTITIQALQNINENKHISVALVKDYSQIVVKHLLLTEDESTEIEVANGYTETKAIGTPYTTSPKNDLDDYVIATNKDYYYDKTEQEICEIYSINNITELNYASFEDFLDDYYIPQNSTGIFREETQVIKYYYKEKTYYLQVEHLIYGTNSKAIDKFGNEIDFEFSDGYKKYVDDTTTPESKYETVRSNAIDYDKYEFVTDSGNTSGTITENTIVKYYYQLKDASNIIVHHYILGTTNKVPSNTGDQVQDQILPGEEGARIGDEYVTANAESLIPINYKVATNKDVYGDEMPNDLIGRENENYIPDNYRGTYSNQEQEVVYYYKMESPEISNTITKTTTKETINISDEDNTIPYNITYSIVTQKYIGDVSITIVDYLPYQIDTNKQYNLDGGEYNSTNKTITWKEVIKDVDTYNNPSSGTINITKNITLKYKDLSDENSSITNNVEASALLISSNTESDKVYDEVEHTFGQTTEYTVTKAWDDNNNALDIRPNSISVTLSAEAEGENYQIPNTVTTTVTLNNVIGNENGNNWTYKWENLAKYTDNGHKITYTVTENSLGTELDRIYSPSYEETANGTNITNTYSASSEKIQITVNKVWAGENGNTTKRPDNIKFIVKSGNTQVSEYTINLISETSHTFELDKFDNKGNPITYTIDEECSSIFYTKSIGTLTSTGTDQYSVEVTNTFSVPDTKVSVYVNKVWVDNNNGNNQRPSSLTIKLINDETGNTEATHNLNITNNENSYTFTNLPKYDSLGNEISYSVDEEGSLLYYSKDVHKNSTYNYTITNTYAIPADKVNIEAEKIWNDSNNAAGKRPSSIILILKNGNSEIARGTTNASKNWKYTFNDLPKYNSSGRIMYTIEEEEVTENDLYFYTSSAGTLNTSNNTITITNTFEVPDDRITITATKIWDDNNNSRGKREPNSIKFVLGGETNTYSQNSYTIDSTNSNNWIFEFTNIPKYNSSGNIISYTLNEEELKEGILDNYIQTINGYTITNKEIITENEITKTGTSRITSINDKLEYTINYEAKITDEYQGKATIRIVDTLPYEIDTSKDFDLNGGVYNNNTKTITWEYINSEEKNISIVKNISFYFKNIDIEELMEEKLLTNNVVSTITLENGVTDIEETNYDTEVDFEIDVVANKIWEGDSLSGTRPNNVSVELKILNSDGSVSNVNTVLGTNYITEQLMQAPDWTCNWQDLPKYNTSTNEEITYTVIEKSTLNDYYTTISHEDNIFNIVNSKYGSIEITKVNKANNSEKIGGVEIKLEKLKLEGSNWVVDDSFPPVTQTTSISAEDLGKTKFSKLQYGKYRLTEIKSSNDFNLLSDNVEIEISAENPDYSRTSTKCKKDIITKYRKLYNFNYLYYWNCINN